MAYGSGGRYHNVGLANKELLPATSRQLIRLKRMTGVDHASRGLNRRQASDLIETYKEKREERKRARDSAPMVEGMYEALFNAALGSADKAGDDWLWENADRPSVTINIRKGAVQECRSDIGDAFVLVDRSSAFFVWARRHDKVDARGRLNLPLKHGDRFEADLKVACASAAARTLSQGEVHGLKVVRTVAPS